MNKASDSEYSASASLTVNNTKFRDDQTTELTNHRNHISNEVHDDRTEQNRTEQNRTGENRAGEDRRGQNGTGED